MCGIIGIANFEAFPKNAFSQLLDRISHRGPDGSDIWRSSDGRVLLGHRRLAILDLATTGDQPMHGASGRYAMVYNGEIYNYVELRAELEALGHRFESTGDAEVLLATYIEWGEQCLNRLNGMFALAVYDRGDANTSSSIFFARDRFGKKPLYVAHNQGKLAFASELKAIPDAMRGGIDLHSLNHYLALGYVPGRLCIAEGVKKLPAAHAARYFIETNEFKQWCWWSIPPYDSQNQIDTDELVDRAEALLHDAVRLRFRSDVPVGVLLSGGLDSSLIVASASQTATSVKTFTVGFPGSNLDETSYADIVAKYFSTDHHLLTLPNPSLSTIEDIAPLIDEPIADSSIIPTYLVSKLTSNHVKVALGGDGGDEIFGGYDIYARALADQARFGFLPDAMFKVVSLIAGSLPAGVPGRNRIYGLWGGPLQSMVWGTPYYDAPARKRVLGPEAVHMLGDQFMAPERYRLSLFLTGDNPVDSLTRTDFGSILTDDFLVKVDRASMAHGLELRCPLLDTRMVEFAFKDVPSDLKIKDNKGRRIQKMLAKRLLPASLNINRKQGFSIPLNDWFRASRGTELQDVRKSLPDFVNQKEVTGLLAGQVKGRANGGRLFSLLTLSIAAKNLS